LAWSAGHGSGSGSGSDYSPGYNTRWHVIDIILRTNNMLLLVDSFLPQLNDKDMCVGHYSLKSFILTITVHDGPGLPGCDLFLIGEVEVVSGRKGLGAVIEQMPVCQQPPDLAVLPLAM
jgi:hypothetical protein